MRRLKLAVTLAATLSFCPPGHAQTVGGAADISVLSGSASTAAWPVSTAPNAYPAVVLTPATGTTIDIRFKVGGSSVTATSTSAVLPPGGICFNPGSNGYISTYGVSGTATLHVTQYSQCPQGIGFAGGGGGGGGGVLINNSGQLPYTATNLGVSAFLYLDNTVNKDPQTDSVITGAADVAIKGCASGVCAPTSPANGVTNSVNITSSGTSVQIAAARTGAIGTGRVSITVFNPVGAPGTLYIGFGTSGTCPSVATLTGNGAGAGVPIAAGAAFTQSVSAQVCGAYAASSGYVPYQESY